MRVAEPSSTWIDVVAHVARRPDLYRVALRQGHRMIPNRWWARRPFLPVPPAPYLRFRKMTSEGGDGTGAPSSSDVVSYLEWCRTQP